MQDSSIPTTVGLLAAIGLSLVHSSASAGSRPIGDFLSRQGTYCAPASENCSDGCYGCAGAGCLLFIPPFPNFLGWQDPTTGNGVSFDYAGLVNGYLGNRFATRISGSITEVLHPDGTVTDHIVLHTDNAVTWAYVGFGGAGTVLFGANELSVAAGATPSLGSCTLTLTLNGPSAGYPLPDLIELAFGCGSWSFGSIGFTGQALGTLANGSPGVVQVTQRGLISTAGLANPHSRVAYDAFPAEHVVIQAIGH
jgi:hypothetical protein